jgi:hypothetical protein
MCHGKAQNVPQHGTKRLLDLNDQRIENKNNNNNNKAIIRAGRATLAAKKQNQPVTMWPNLSIPFSRKMSKSNIENKRYASPVVKLELTSRKSDINYIPSKKT